MTDYFRPLVQTGSARPTQAQKLAGGWGWFTAVEVLQRHGASRFVDAQDLPKDVLVNLTQTRADIAGCSFDAPQIMGILNVTPDSFSDGGLHAEADAATRAAARMVADGAHILDIGGESTRPGAAFVPEEEEISRTAPVIAALRDTGMQTPISIDTRKAAVARAALDTGASLVNDVSGFTFDPDLAPLCTTAKAPVCVMHAQGDPKTMQQDPRYDDVLLDVYDFLSDRIDALVAAGIPKSQIIADPGIGFGKTLDHNLRLLQNISLFHALGVTILLGASRKRFIGTLSGVDQADERVAGSLAVALAAVAQGVQIVRVHDVAQTAQALRLWSACTEGQRPDG